MGFHGVVILDRADVGLLDGDGGSGEAFGEVAAFVASGLLAGVFRPAGFVEA